MDVDKLNGNGKSQCSWLRFKGLFVETVPDPPASVGNARLFGAIEPKTASARWALGTTWSATTGVPASKGCARHPSGRPSTG